MTFLFVIRHGQASFGNEQYDQLSELGMLQARILGDFFRRCAIGFEGFFSGPKNRQMQTAATVMAQMFPEGAVPRATVLDELTEYDAARIIKRYFESEGCSSDQAVEKIKETLKDPDNFFQIFKGAVRMWFAGQLSAEGLESRTEFRERVVRGFARIGAAGDRNTKNLVFTSGGVIAAVMQEALGVGDETAFDLAWDIRNASISVFEYRHGKLRLLSFNAVAHLEIEADPRLLTYR